jgi:quinoprotein glucose dehydrogenase
MPAFGDLEEGAINRLFEYLSAINPPAGASNEPVAKSQGTRGPVIASGGAPGGLDLRPRNGGQYSPLGGPPYPPGTKTPTDRYYTDWGLYPNQPYIISPPWSSVVAYDLNAGTIKWKVPLGQDAVAEAEGARDTGAFMAEHHGMIVTSTGLIFIAASDGKIRALDEDTGKVLWTATLPAGSEGIPSMYEAKGRQFLVVPASSKINSGGGHAGSGRTLPSAVRADLPKGYVAFALPEVAISKPSVGTSKAVRGK